jgi:hypothetical protein
MGYEFKGTPGPWYAVQYAYFFNIQTDEYYDTKHINVLDCEVCDKAEQNANLIAAAPDLLTAAIEVVKCLANANDRPYERHLLQAAIHKALDISPDILGSAINEPELSCDNGHHDFVPLMGMDNAYTDYTCKVCGVKESETIRPNEEARTQARNNTEQL